MKGLHDQQFAVTVDGQTGFAFDAAVKQTIGVGMFVLALIEHGFSRHEGGGEVVNEGGSSGGDQFCGHANSVKI
jgi:hypothetical protein